MLAPASLIQYSPSPSFVKLGSVSREVVLMALSAGGEFHGSEGPARRAWTRSVLPAPPVSTENPSSSPSKRSDGAEVSSGPVSSSVTITGACHGPQAAQAAVA